MSRRSRERKARKLAEEKNIRQELRARASLEWAPWRKWMLRIGLGFGGLAVLGALVWAGIWGFQQVDWNGLAGKVKGPFGEITKEELAQNKFATLETSQGNIKIELDTDNTPKTAASFVLLAKRNFYDGIKFHRVIKDFMIQTGDPNSKDDDPSDDGTGGPGYQFDDEKIVGEYSRGTVAMANSGANTNGSQFFIVHQDATDLPKSYVIFGKVVEGMDVVDKIAAMPVEDNGQGEVSRPKTPIVINKITLSEQ
ncbi:MAG: peptidylprolyl isomerase [Patescibacteria group bacterium]|jgi:peptidylprolyl isomerase